MTHDDDPVDRLLEARQRAEVTPPDAAFADRLESRLRVLHADLATSTPRRIGRRLLLAAAGTAVAAAALALALLPADDAEELVIAAAIDTEVLLPAGRVEPARPGLVLPDGAVIRTGPHGAVTVDGVRLPARTTAVVDDGDLVITDRGPTRPTSTTAAPTTTSAPAPPTTASPAPSSTRPPTTSATAPSREPEGLTLHVSVTDRRAVQLEWSAYDGDDFDRYLVERHHGDRVVVLAELVDRTANEWIDEPPDPSVAYRVRAVDTSDRTVALSPLVSA